MKKVYILNEEKGFNKIFDNEGIEENKRSEILNGLNLLTLKIEIERKNGDYYQFIYDEQGNRKNINDFNPYYKSLIGGCFNHFIGLSKQLNELIEVIN